MVKMTDCSGKTEKIKSIIEVAQRLFGIYGIEKVSMQEIADELNLSKASLYYYFPDKESLYIAVIEKEQDEFLSKIHEQTGNIADPSEFLKEYAIRRLSFFRTLLNLSRLRSEYFSNLKPVFSETVANFREKERIIISGILEKGIKDRSFTSLDTFGTAILYLDLLRGLRIATINSKKQFYIDREEYDKLMKKTVDFTEIFVKGLRSV
jgi:AcrR family transcriptional regulator